MKSNSTTAKKESPSVEAKFWYKAHGQGANGHAIVYQGGIPAETAAAALSAVKAMSTAWSAKKMYTIYIYKLEPGGVCGPEPEIFLNLAGQPVIPQKNPGVVKKHDPTLEEVYDKAAWTSKFVQVKSFPTVTLKE